MYEKYVRCIKNQIIWYHDAILKKIFIIKSNHVLRFGGRYDLMFISWQDLIKVEELLDKNFFYFPLRRYLWITE